MQHLLYTTLNLLESFKRLGAQPDNIHVMGKSYSSCLAVANKLIDNGYRYYPNSEQSRIGNFSEIFQRDIECMWGKIFADFIKKEIVLIVVLDDGGNCMANIPSFVREKYRIVGVEQTSSGLNNSFLKKVDFPVVEVASCAVKQRIESPMIAEAVVQKLISILPIGQERLPCAVVGLGVIGQAVLKKLSSLKHEVIAYEKNKIKKIKSDFMMADSLQSAIANSNYIFGCSGEDITEDLELLSEIFLTKENKFFISCSSQDKEFLSLLKKIDSFQSKYESCLDDVIYTLENKKTIKILKGGFPINLDTSGESVGALDIQLTRGLLLGGVLQAIFFATHYPNDKNLRYMLNPAIQRFIVSHWIPHGSTFLFEPDFINLFFKTEWLEENSGGINNIKDIYLEEAFGTCSSIIQLS